MPTPAERAKLFTPQVLRQIEEANKKRPKELTLVPSEARARADSSVPAHMVPARCWLSRKYMVQEFVWPDRPIRLSINRVSVRKDGHFEDGLTWDELMHVKKEIGYGDSWAMEIYPAESSIVNDANMRHLWVVPRPDFAWSKGD